LERLGSDWQTKGRQALRSSLFTRLILFRTSAGRTHPLLFVSIEGQGWVALSQQLRQLASLLFLRHHNQAPLAWIDVHLGASSQTNHSKHAFRYGRDD